MGRMAQDSQFVERLNTRLSSILRRIDGGNPLNLAVLATAVGFVVVMLAMLVVVAFSDSTPIVQESDSIVATREDAALEIAVRGAMNAFTPSDSRPTARYARSDHATDVRDAFGEPIPVVMLGRLERNEQKHFYVDLDTFTSEQRRDAITGGLVVWDGDTIRRRYGYWPNGRIKFIATESVRHGRWEWDGHARARFFSKTGAYVITPDGFYEPDTSLGRVSYFTATVADSDGTDRWQFSIGDKGKEYMKPFTQRGYDDIAISDFNDLQSGQYYSYTEEQGSIKRGCLPREIEEAFDASLRTAYRIDGR